MSLSWEVQCHALYEDIKKQTLIIKEQQEEINRLTIAYQNASDQRQYYVDKCLRLSEVVLELSNCMVTMNSFLEDYNIIEGSFVVAMQSEKSHQLLYKHKDLLNELEHNLEDKK